MKLVRDFIPEIIEEDGKTCYWRRVADRSEHMYRLKLKIIEEAEEFIENPCCEEAADMLEVVQAFASINELNFDDVIATAQNKAIKRGGFEEGIVLVKVHEQGESRRSDTVKKAL